MYMPTPGTKRNVRGRLNEKSAAEKQWEGPLIAENTARKAQMLGWGGRKRRNAGMGTVSL